MPSRQLPKALARLADAEARFLASEFLAPVVRGGSVSVRIAGVVCRFRVAPRGYTGWGVFRATSPTEARLVRQASLAQRQRYLELLPQVRLILCGRDGDDWFACAAHQGDPRLRGWTLMPVRLIHEAALFNTILARFDGTQFWYDGPDPRADASAGAYLRTALEQLTLAAALNRPGLTLEQRTAYALQLGSRQQAARDPQEVRLRQALGATGARFLSYQEQGDVFAVTYELDGAEHVAAVRRTDLTVQAAGLCLSGRDADFDLQSLVGVLREHAEGG